MQERTMLTLIYQVFSSVNFINRDTNTISV